MRKLEKTMTFNIKVQVSWANQVPLRLLPLDTSPVPSSGSGLLKCNRDFQPLFYSPGMQLSTPSALPLQTPTSYLEAYALFVSPISLTKLFQVISMWHLFSRPSSSHPSQSAAVRSYFVSSASNSGHHFCFLWEEVPRGTSTLRDWQRSKIPKSDTSF